MAKHYEYLKAHVHMIFGGILFLFFIFHSPIIFIIRVGGFGVWSMQFLDLFICLRISPV